MRRRYTLSRESAGSSAESVRGTMTEEPAFEHGARRSHGDRQVGYTAGGSYHICPERIEEPPSFAIHAVRNSIAYL
jgi:hypothetical protein